MANPNWVKGGPSANPEGRRKTKHSARTVKGMIENFVKRNISPQKLQGLYNELQAKEKLQFLVEVLPYTTPKQSAMTLNFEKMSDEELSRHYEQALLHVNQDFILPFISPEEPVTIKSLPEKISDSASPKSDLNESENIDQ